MLALQPTFFGSCQMRLADRAGWVEVVGDQA
jgi:hypothetical protein